MSIKELVRKFMAALFLIAKGGNNPNAHQLINGYTKCNNGILSSPKKD